MTKGKTAVPGVTRSGRTDRRTVDPDAPRTCDRCGRLRAAGRFPEHSARRADGTRYRRRTCADCLGVAGKPTRPPRYDGSGNVRCANCRRYLPASLFRWLACPSLPKPKYNPYCTPCQRALDRLRWTGARRARLNRRRVANQRAQAAREHADRAKFVRDAIALLRRRGLTKSEVARLAGVDLASVLAWESGARRPDPAIAERFVVVLRETRHLPPGDAPAYRRRLPHPEMPALLARCGPLVAAIPVRSRWKGGGR